MSADAFLVEELAKLRRAGTLRSLREMRGAAGPIVDIGGKQVLMFCSNNYLGLADDERVKDAARQAISEYGGGATGSRLISGNSKLYDCLETALADFKGTEASLVFSSGYHANVGTIPALAGQGDVIISDEMNHASIIDACRLSRAEVSIYRHCDIGHLGELLHKWSGARRILVVTESIFSMDGDIAPLGEISSLAEEHGALLMVDEAHGTGVAGANGSGVVEALGLRGKVEVQMGTFSKALGSLGGYVAGSRKLIAFLLNTARSFIFTTGLPPSVLGASRAALEIARSEGHRRDTLVRHSCKLRAGLRSMGFSLGPSESQIIPIIIGDDRLTIAACRYLLRQGIYVQGIRPPTVPTGTARLRISPMATHTNEQIDAVLRAFGRLAEMLGRRREEVR